MILNIYSPKRRLINDCKKNFPTIEYLNDKYIAVSNIQEIIFCNDSLLIYGDTGRSVPVSKYDFKKVEFSYD